MKQFLHNNRILLSATGVCVLTATICALAGATTAGILILMVGIGLGGFCAYRAVNKHTFG